MFRIWDSDKNKYLEFPETPQEERNMKWEKERKDNEAWARVIPAILVIVFFLLMIWWGSSGGDVSSWTK
jgi:hypothetical protein